MSGHWEFFDTYVNQAGFQKLRERLCADSYSQSIWNGKCHADFWIKTFPCQMFAKFPKFTISENDQIIFCCFLQDNVSCGRGQNYQVYKHGFHEETSAHRQSSLLVAPAIQRTIFQALIRKFDTNNKQRQSMTWWSRETSNRWKQKEQEARGKENIEDRLRNISARKD